MQKFDSRRNPRIKRKGSMLRGLVEALRIRHHHDQNIEHHPLGTVVHKKEGQHYIGNFADSVQNNNFRDNTETSERTTTSAAIDNMQEATLTESTIPTHNRSVSDFDTADQLREALLAYKTAGGCSTTETAWLFAKNDRVLQELLRNDNIDETNRSIDKEPGLNKNNLDWIVENYDKANSHEFSVDQELRRLLVLKSFLLLDTSKKESFDSITRSVQQTFAVPICLISLIDLGRQWFLSKQGLDACETPRNVSFCTHCVQSKLDLLEVTDPTQDPRFRNNPLVTGKPHIRYYVGAPLVSPEGYKLGTLCIIDNDWTKHREPLSLEQREKLKNYAALAVETMVKHRYKMASWFNNLVSTHFPDETTHVDEKHMDNEGAIIKPDEEEDEQETDKAFLDFIEATANLSLENLIDMLKKEAQKELPPEIKRDLGSAMAVEESTRPTKRPATVKKWFRFDETEDGNVRTQVFEIESWKSMKDLWISPDEMADNRQKLRKLVHYYRTKRKDYVDTISDLIEKPNGNVQDLLRKLVHSKARGLESHIVDLLRETRKATRQAVMREQWYHWQDPVDDFDSVMKCLRHQSLVYSRLGTSFAQNLAKVDHIYAVFRPRTSVAA